MYHSLPSPRLLIVATFLASVMYVQFRGRVRHKLSRLVADHANLLAPSNALMYLFSSVKANPYVDVREFPELRAVTAQWQTIREEALKLFDEGHLRVASGYNDIGCNTFFGLVTPNSPDCHIIVDGEKYYWKDGAAVMFDETYIHQAENRTDVTRVILFCDIERPLSNPVLRWINRTIGRRMIRAAATQNIAGEHVGALNHIFSYVHRIRALGLRIKERNKPLYYALKWALLAALGYAIAVGF